MRADNAGELSSPGLDGEHELNSWCAAENGEPSSQGARD